MAFRADEFDSGTAQDLKTGGDGQKQFEWRVSGGSNCDAIDVNTSNSGYMTFDMNATDSRLGATTAAAYAYQYITGDFDVETLFTGNGDATYESGYLIVASDANHNIHAYIQEYAGANSATKWVVGVRSSNGTTESVVGTDVFQDLADVQRYWRVVRSGNDFTFYRKKASGDAWTSHATTTRSDIGTRVRVGVGAETWNTSNTFVAKFDYWRGTVANTRDYPAAQSIARQAVTRSATR